MEKPKVQKGSSVADAKYRITILNRGPYVVFGQPPLDQQFILPDEERISWSFADGEEYKMEEPAAICRCGASTCKPYCDGAHLETDWDPTLTASEDHLLDGAELYKGPVISLTDNEEYCVFARFCDAKGRVWNLVGQSDDKEARELVIREANMCPGGRLSAWDNASQEPFEPHYDPSLSLIEDPALRISGGLWVRGGIPVRKENGETYEIRNRVVLCRCGQASNKPFCDGTHASMKFHDGLPDTPKKTSGR